MSNKLQKYPVAWVPLLYFAEGLPYMAVMIMSVFMYKSMGIGNTELAFYTSLLYLPWVIKPLWSPIVDILNSKRWWILTMQWTIAITMALVAFSVPTSYFFLLTLSVFWVMAFASATHDIAADGFYMLALDSHQQSVWVGIRSLAYRLSMLTGQGALVYLAAEINKGAGSQTIGWFTVFAILAATFAFNALYLGKALPRPASDSIRPNISVSQTIEEFGQTFVSFFKKKQVIVALLFMLLYRLPEAQLVKMIPPFLMDPVEKGGLGIDEGTVGVFYGIFGAAGLIAGGIIGGLCAAHRGLKAWLHPMAWSMSLSCLTFMYLAFFQPSELWQVLVCIVVEQFGYGFGFTAYMLYLIYFSAGRFKTAHYSICTGFMALGMMLPGMFSGWIADTFQYTGFFSWCMICCICTIGVCYLIKVSPDFGIKKKSTDNTTETATE